MSFDLGRAHTVEGCLLPGSSLGLRVEACVKLFGLFRAHLLLCEGGPHALDAAILSTSGVGMMGLGC